MALKPSINAFALLESDEPGDVGAPAKVDDAASRPVNINKKQQPQMSVWKANKVKAEANAAKNKQLLQQPGASKAKANSSAANAAGKYKKPQQPKAPRAQATKTAANAAANGQFQQHSPAPVNLTQILFGNAYPSPRGLIYKNRTQNAAANAKDGGAGGATRTTDDKTGVHANGAATKKHDGPAPVQEEPAAPVKPVLPPAPAPSLDDSAQFPSLK